MSGKYETCTCGYVTAALVSNGLAHPKSHGLATEFDYLPRNYLSYAREIVRDSLAYSPSFSGQSLIDLYPFGQLVNAADRLASRMRPDWRPYSPDAQIDDALAWASKRTQDPNPIFVWTHLFPPHHFYLPPDPYLKSIDNSDDFSTYASQDFDYGYYKDDHQPDVNKLRSRYDENLRWADASLGRYIRGLDALGLLDGALVIVTSDHGESFSHGYWGHIGPMLHEDLIHIPLVIKLPRQHAGKRISDVSELIDLFPTILDVVGLAPPTDIEGQSLLPSIRGQDGQRATAVSMQLDASSALGRATAGTIALVTPRFKLIRHVKAGAGRDELYDLVADPDEARNIARDKKDKLEEMRSTLRRLSGSRLNDPADDLTDSSGQQRGLSM